VLEIVDDFRDEKNGKSALSNVFSDDRFSKQRPVLGTLADLPFAPAVYAIENVVNGKVDIFSSLNARRRGAIISRRCARAATPSGT
jgi:hypothetical protein